jgi:hypothetical protein
MERYMRIKNFVFLFFFTSSAFAQDIEVKKFEPMAKDQTATMNPRMDINDVACGLVKVQFELENLQFEGNYRC